MGGFFSVMIEEIGARRRRFRLAFGNWGQALSEFLTFAGLAVGSFGLFVRPWMPDVASWGFAVPVVFVLGHLLLEWRRQAKPTPEDKDDAETRTSKYDWGAFLFSLACAVAGLAAFVIGISSEPASVVDEGWQPPTGAVQSTIVPEH
jgi:hypothetical protein